MKYVYMMFSGCSIGLVAANFISYDLSDIDIDSILQARALDSHLDLFPRSYRLQQQIHGMGPAGRPPRGGSPPAKLQRQGPYQRHGMLLRQTSRPVRAASPGKSEESGKNPDKPDKPGKAEKEPAASASIHAKGSAALHVASAGESKYLYNPYNKEDGLEIDHYHKVVAAGAIQGTPGTPIPDAAKQAPSEHPLIAKSSARAVSARVQAPRGGAGRIKIETPEKKETFDVKGGTTESQSGTAEGEGKAKATASVTHGGHVRVMGGPTEKSLQDEPL